jgi:hypothetical protein
MEISLVSNIENAIIRSKQVMEESKAITRKTLQRKNMLQENFSHDEPEKNHSLNNSSVIQRVSELDIRTHPDFLEKPLENLLKIEELQNQVNFLTQKVSSQDLTIRILQDKIIENNLEKAQLINQLKVVRKEYQAEIDQVVDRYNKDKNYKDSYDPQETKRIEERITSLEEKYRLQVSDNQNLLETIKKLQNGEIRTEQTQKISELEDILIDSMRKYKVLKERLEKTECLISLDKTCRYNSDSSNSKYSKPLSPKYSTGSSIKKNPRKSLNQDSKPKITKKKKPKPLN